MQGKEISWFRYLCEMRNSFSHSKAYSLLFTSILRPSRYSFKANIKGHLYKSESALSKLAMHFAFDPAIISIDVAKHI